MEIRPAHGDDAARLASLAGELGYESDAAAIATRLRRIGADGAGACFVAAGREGVVGWIHVFESLRLESEPAAEIGGLVVARAARGRGVGAALIERAAAWSRERGLARLRVRSRVERAGAHRFYERLGFEAIKTQRVFERGEA